MPTKREREYYAMGYRDGIRGQVLKVDQRRLMPDEEFERRVEYTGRGIIVEPSPLMRAIAKPKRKLSAWQKYIKNKRNHIKYRDGKLNLKKMGVEFRRKQRR